MKAVLSWRNLYCWPILSDFQFLPTNFLNFNGGRRCRWKSTCIFQWRIQPSPPPPSPSLFLDQPEARRGYSRVWMTAPTPPPLSKGLDDRGPPLSQGLDPTLHFVASNLSPLWNTTLPLLLGFAQTSLFFLLISYSDRLSASLTRDLGTRLFSHYFFCFYIYFIDFIFSSLDICFIPFTFGTTVLIGTFVNI